MIYLYIYKYIFKYIYIHINIYIIQHQEGNLPSNISAPSVSHVGPESHND